MIHRRSFLRRVYEWMLVRPGYVWGGKSRTGADCSGFVTGPLFEASDGAIDLRATHNTDRLWTEFPRVSREEALPGDVALYFGEHSTGPDDVSHAMVYLGEGLVCGQAYGGPKDTNAEASRAAGKVTQVLSVDYRPDLAGFVRLPLT